MSAILVITIIAATVIAATVIFLMANRGGSQVVAAPVSRCGGAAVMPSNAVHLKEEQPQEPATKPVSNDKKKSYDMYKAAMLKQQVGQNDRDNFFDHPKSSGFNAIDMFSNQGANKIKETRLNMLQKTVSEGIAPPSNGLF